MNTFPMLWAILTQKQKKKSLALFILILFSSCLEILGLGLIVPLIAAMTSMDYIIDNKYLSFILHSWPNLSHENIVYGILGTTVIVYLFKTIFLVIVSWIQAGFILKLQADVSRRLFRSYLLRPWLLYKQDNSSLYIQNVNNEVQLLTSSGFGVVFEILSNCVLATLALTVLLAAEPIATSIILLIMGGAFVLFQQLSKVRVHHWGRIRKEHEANRLKCLQQGVNCAKEIKLWGCFDFFINQFHVHSEKLIYSGRWQSALRSFPKYFFEFLAILNISILIFSLLIGGYKLESIAPIVALFAAIFVRLMPCVNSILAGFHSLRYISSTIHMIHEELKQPHINNGDFGHEQIDRRINLDFRNIHFQYYGQNSPALCNINLQIPHGHFLGIIGESGAGKSTLVDITLGLITPTKGSILANGHDIQSNLTSWQKHIGYVPQKIYLLDDTLRRNIAFGLLDNEINDEQIISCIKQAQLNDFFAKLPEGLDTVLGDDGSFLSGGERQRIALARALYRQPSVLILDEATSSLDSETELGVMNAIKQLKGKCTIISVTHRLTSVKDYDSLIRINKGTIQASYDNIYALISNDAY
ncbi:ABC transporter ATP-binding protein [Nitratidesulfovibrio vulgaris]|uniref:ABC transporter ATP-binding protein n=1 Tax=Nitratidesulfovibrio vulgaris TaxID=881 RepID=UPI0023009042|nr:ABC transporter ATP-binding protein [Nitratidesulfovibrio vulgaris]WCB45558.1 ABC transporter ATP-binding protein [Nitratidesulfovibrio vulgaris]